MEIKMNSLNNKNIQITIAIVSILISILFLLFTQRWDAGFEKAYLMFWTINNESCKDLTWTYCEPYTHHIMSTRMALAPLAIALAYSTLMLTTKPTHDPIIDFIKKLYRGEFGLFKTFWAIGFPVSLFFTLISRGTNNTAVLAIIFAIYTLLEFIIISGVWRSAIKYEGNRLWAYLAFAACILGVMMILGGNFSIFSTAKFTS